MPSTPWGSLLSAAGIGRRTVTLIDFLGHAAIPDHGGIKSAALFHRPLLGGVVHMQLYEQDKAEAMEFVNNAQRILRKMGSGQKLTKEERDMVKNDLRLQKKIAKKTEKPLAGT